MTVHSFDTAKVLGKYEREISGSFRPNGSSAISATTTTGLGFTASYVSTGVYRITLNFPFAGFKSITHKLRMATGEADVHELRTGDFDVSTKLFEIEHLHSADTTATHPVAADIASAAANVIDFTCKVIVDDGPGSGIPG